MADLSPCPLANKQNRILHSCNCKSEPPEEELLLAGDSQRASEMPAARLQRMGLLIAQATSGSFLGSCAVLF